mgnify:CR=1 FL=1
MNILIVGAGAVGLVYGHHFANAGHNVTFLVKEKYQSQLEQEKNEGSVLYYLNTDKALKKPIRFKQFNVISQWEQAVDFDVIALAISSTALRQLPLDKLKPLLNEKRHKKPSTSLLMLQPSDEDFAHLAKTINPEQILQGMITLISYQTDDINNGISPAGIAYYLPPLPMPISAIAATQQGQGSNASRDEVIQLFKQSGIKAKAVNSALDESRLISAFFMTFLCALEAANWEFDRLRKSPQLLRQLSDAQQKLLPPKLPAAHSRVMSALQSLLKVMLKLILKPWFYKALIVISPKAVPLPLEAYLKKHFLKVRSQTLLYMRDYQKQSPSNAVAELIALID